MSRLSQEELIVLIERIQACDNSAFVTIYHHFLPVIISITNNFLKGHYFHEDLVAAGSLGLYKSVMKFRKEHNTSPSTYLYGGIQLEVLNETRRLHKVSAQARKHWKKVKEIIDELKKKQNTDEPKSPSMQDIAHQAGVHVDVVEEIVLSYGRLTSQEMQFWNSRPASPKHSSRSSAILFDRVYPLVKHSASDLQMLIKFVVLFVLFEKGNEGYKWAEISAFLELKDTALMGQSPEDESPLWTLMHRGYDLPEDIPEQWENVVELFTQTAPGLFTPGALAKFYSRAKKRVFVFFTS